MRYVAITGENFYFQEMKNTCEFLIKNNYEIENINFREELKLNDILDCKSESNFNKKFQTINKRIKILNNNLKKMIINKNFDTGKFINLYAILCKERFIAEFIDEIVREKYMNFDYIINESDFKYYFEYKSEQSEEVNNWSLNAKKEMLKKIKRFLSEGGFLKKEKDGIYKIYKPLIENEVIEEIRKNGNEKILKAMLF